MQAYKLSKNEKLVLYGLVRYPENNDIQIADKMGVKRPTVSKIKGKLAQEGLFKTYNIPNYFAVGAEIMTYYNSLHAISTSGHTKVPEEYVNLATQPSFINVRSGSETVGLAVFKNFSHLRSIHEKIIEETLSFGVLKKNTNVLLALSLTEYPVYFEAAYHVDQTYELGLFDGKYERMNVPDEPLKFTTKDRIILEALVQYPDATDTLISEKLGVARPTVSEKRAGFYSNGTIKRINLPDFTKLGYEILCFCDIPYNKKLDALAGIDTPELIQEILNPLFLARNSIECVAIFIAADYSEYKRLIEELARRRNQSLEDELEPQFTPISSHYLIDFRLQPESPMQRILNTDKY